MKNAAKALRDTSIANMLIDIVDDYELMEIARQAIEDRLVEFRDERLSTLRGNGLVIRERDGSESSIIRFGPETAVAIGLNAIAQHLKGQ
jgi:hypothetical protein